MTFEPHISEQPPVRATAPTAKQLDYVRGMQRRLHLSDRLLDTWCAERYGQPVTTLSVGQCSQLIDEMIGWTSIPAELMRLAGQMDMFGGAR